MDKEYIAEYKDTRMGFVFAGGSNRECERSIKVSMKRLFSDIDFKSLKIKELKNE